MKLLFILGTRPEAIKLAPLIVQAKIKGMTCRVINTRQQPHLASSALKDFSIFSDVELDNDSASLSHLEVLGTLLPQIQAEILEFTPDFVLVQGDTNTALAGALSSYFTGSVLIHVEAGLRTKDLNSPFPEEGNRRLISQIAELHLAPTQTALDNLLKFGVPRDRIYVSGNTVIDSVDLVWNQLTLDRDTFQRPELNAWRASQRRGLLTLHRRENFDRLPEILTSVMKVASNEDLHFLVPVHTNPRVSKQMHELLGQSSHFSLVPPFNYIDLLSVLKFSKIVMTDSGGIQEEVSCFGTPTLILRTETERTEVLQYKNVLLGGISESSILNAYEEISNFVQLHTVPVNERQTSPFGSGKSRFEIIDILTNQLRKDTE